MSRPKNPEQVDFDAFYVDEFDDTTIGSYLSIAFGLLGKNWTPFPNVVARYDKFTLALAE